MGACGVLREENDKRKSVKYCAISLRGLVVNVLEDHKVFLNKKDREEERWFASFQPEWSKYFSRFLFFINKHFLVKIFWYGSVDRTDFTL